VSADELTAATAIAERFLDNIETVVHGKREQIKLVVAALMCGGHALLEDVPGTAKTVLARAIAGSIRGSRASRIQCTPDLQPTDVTGLSIFNQKERDFEFRPGPVFANIVLVDEINRAMPKTQSALLEAMAEQQVTVDGETRLLEDPFLVMATQNPIEYEGTYPLPEAQLDRFLLKIILDYPTVEAEQEVVANWDAGFNARRLDRVDIQPLPDADAISRCRAMVREAKMEQGVQQYVVDVVRRSRAHPSVLYGGSPRASVALLLCSKALAAIRGRDFATPDDVRGTCRLSQATPPINRSFAAARTGPLS
jgi:MoxR-like ATPase